jgi:phage-related protein
VTSQAEVDLVVNATRTLPDLERDLNRVLLAAQADMSDLDVNAVLNTTTALNQIDRDLARVISGAQAGADDLLIQAALNQQASIRAVTRDLDNLVNTVDTGGTVDDLLLTAALNGPASLRQVTRDVDELVAVTNATAPDIEIDVEISRRLLSDIGAVAGALGSLGKNIGLAGAAAGTAVPLLAGVAAAAQQILPAAAVATSGILAMQLATQTLKLGFLGVGDAITEAFKPDADMAKVKEALDHLSPSAKAAATEIIGLKDTFKGLQLDVQENLFKNFDQAVTALATTALPIVHTALTDTATSLNAMGISVAQAAVRLSADGTLGAALKGATTGLDNLKGVPAEVATGFTQLAAAAAPAFDRITTAVAKVADRVSEQLSGAFKSGALEGAINDAVDAIAQLGRVGGNIFSGLGNIIGAVTVDGAGLFDTLEQLSQGFKDVTASKTFQTALGDLAATMALIYKTVGPLVATALETIGQVIIQLAEPAQQLVTVLGSALTDIFKSLGPVLVSLADAFGKLVVALLPIVTLAAQLIAEILPVLVPQFEAFGAVFEAMTPFIQQFADLLAAVLLPVLAELPGIVATILPPFVQFAEEIMPQLTEQLVQLTPAFASLGEQLALLLVAVAPVIAQILEMALAFSAHLMPVITEGATVVIAGLAVLLTGLAAIFRTVVVPAVQFLVDALRGDFFDSTSSASQAVGAMRDRIVNFFSDMAGRVSATLSGYVATLRSRVSEGASSFVDGVRSMSDRAVATLSSLPSRLRGALGNLGSLLFSAGASLISGLIDGIQSRVGGLISELGDITSKIPDWKGPADTDRSLLIPSGVMVMDGFLKGIQKAIPRVKAEFQGITGALPGFTQTISSVTAPSTSNVLAPTILVTIGNEAVDQFVTTRVEAANKRNARVAAQGVRL